ncbi:patatin-domain-containing protein [Rhizopus microsporus]|uniref:Patatin-domain-containing protein n=1 Tax=Rhizopus microsporus TaxID=58291 RepID=A0A1X0S5E6_RHIZD|nr:patatin-domain-containing protein [Rhizopus microsporus]
MAIEASVETNLFPFCASKLYNKLVNSNQKAYYEHLLKTATTYDEWAEAATKLDELEGLNEWKEQLESPDYDWELVKARLDQLREIRKLNKGQSAMIFALRTSLARNLGDMGNLKLYSHAHIGTKNLTTDYIEEVVKQLNWICDESADPEEDPGLDLKAKHDFFMNIRQSFGRTALLLSGGGTLGMNHIGVVRTLYERNLLPRIISGASSGSIIASFICIKTEDELPYAFDPDQFKQDYFENSNEPESFFTRLQRLFSQGQFLDVDRLQRILRHYIGELTFQEAFNRTRWILNITVSSSTVYDMPRLLNYLTAPDVLIWSAVAASCAIPVFYGSTQIYAKDKNGKVVPWNPSEQLYIDGSVENDLPMNKLSELFNVNHFIVSQVNPHVIPFLQKSNTPSKTRQITNFCMHLAKTEIQHRCTQIQTIMSQKYSGDITIIPEVSYSDFLRVLSNPTAKSIRDAILRGERATWPKLSIIRNHLQIELAIDQILYRLRLLRLNELQSNKISPPRPVMESRSVSHLSITTTAKMQQNEQEKETEMTCESGSQPIVSDQVLKKRERSSTKRGLMMTRPK